MSLSLPDKRPSHNPYVSSEYAPELSDRSQFRAGINDYWFHYSSSSSSASSSSSYRRRSHSSLHLLPRSFLQQVRALLCRQFISSKSSSPPASSSSSEANSSSLRSFGSGIYSCAFPRTFRQKTFSFIHKTAFLLLKLVFVSTTGGVLL